MGATRNHPLNATTNPTPAAPAESTLRPPDPVAALAAHGAHIVLADDEKRPYWDGRAYSWTKRRPSDAVIRNHAGLFGIVPWSIQSTALDVDAGDPSALTLTHPPFADLPTRRPGGHHLYFDDDAPRGNADWHGFGCRGEVRGAKGYLLLWQDGARLLLDALDARQRHHRPFPRDLFEAAGLEPIRVEDRASHRHRGGVYRVLAQPVDVATVGCRSVSLFEHLRRVADVTNRPRTTTGALDATRWIGVVEALALDAYERMPVPRLDWSEVQRTAYSIGTWAGSGHSLRDHSPRRQSARGRRSGTARRSAIEDRDREIVRLLAAGATVREAAAAMGVHYSTAARSRDRLLHEPVSVYEEGGALGQGDLMFAPRLDLGVSGG